MSEENIKFSRVWAMSNSLTFSIKPIAELLKEEVDRTKLWIDPFANNSKWASVTNDMNPEMDTNYHMDAIDFLKMFDSDSVDGVLYDPPYSLRQVSECYKGVGKEVTMETTQSSWRSKHLKEIGRIVKIGGKAIFFGWNSAGGGKKYGFDITRILLVPHGGMKNDTIVTVCEKTHEPFKEKKNEILK